MSYEIFREVLSLIGFLLKIILFLLKNQVIFNNLLFSLSTFDFFCEICRWHYIYNRTELKLGTEIRSPELVKRLVFPTSFGVGFLQGNLSSCENYCMWRQIYCSTSDVILVFSATRLPQTSWFCMYVPIYVYYLNTASTLKH